MGGIINYFHGESGVIVDYQQIVNEEQHVHAIRLQYDPHREFAYEYGGDVGIDPLLKPGDRAIFIRTDTYTGIWVREQDQFYPELQRAVERVTERRMRDVQPGHIVGRLAGIWAEQYIGDLTKSKTQPQFSERPATDISFFLSYSRRNALLARQIFEDLRYDAKIDVWFDLNQEGEAGQHPQRVEAWLREAVYKCRGFVLLWSKASKDSKWVNQEMLWASEKAARDPDFHFIILKIDSEPAPTDIIDKHYIVDCYDVWPVNGIAEELYAAITKRSGRTAWLEEHGQRGVLVEKDEGSLGYEPFQSDSGVARSLYHWEEDGEFCWRLEYETDQTVKIASGQNQDQAVDLEIKPGDQIGFFVCHRAPLVRFWPGIPIWMRSRDLRIRPENVAVTYRQRSKGKGRSGNLDLS